MRSVRHEREFVFLEEESRSRRDVIDVITLQLPMPRVYFDCNSDFNNCDCEDYYDVVHDALHDIEAMSALTSLLHEQKEIVEEKFALWVVVDFVKL